MQLYIILVTVSFNLKTKPNQTSKHKTPKKPKPQKPLQPSSNNSFKMAMIY